MSETTTIAISKDTLERLNALKVHPREPNNDVIKRVLDTYEKLRTRVGDKKQ